MMMKTYVTKHLVTKNRSGYTLSASLAINVYKMFFVLLFCQN